MEAQIKGFDPSAFEGLAGLEEGNFWFESRNDLITWALRRYCPEAADFLEVGCGTGFVLTGIHDAAPHLRLTGTELFSEGLDFARARVPNATLEQVDARDLPYDADFDVVGIFDVLEHIKEDTDVLPELHAALRPGGRLLITVPQHRWLWSPIDDASMHCRRYTRGELKSKVEAAGFTTERVTSFVSLLLPVMAAARFVDRFRDREVNAELEIRGPLNSAMRRVLAAEVALIRRGVSFPAGGSLLLIARKP